MTKQREIKFRSYNPVLNRMIDDRATKYILHCQAESSIEVNSECIIMQYTGLLDKNGNEIYEGDIVKFYTQYHKHGINKIVEWDDLGMWLPFRDDSYIQDEQGDWFQNEKGFKIVGNIYENPELLKS